MCSGGRESREGVLFAFCVLLDVLLDGAIFPGGSEVARVLVECGRELDGAGRMACLGDGEMRGLSSVFGDGSVCRLQKGSWSSVYKVETWNGWKELGMPYLRWSKFLWM